MKKFLLFLLALIILAGGFLVYVYNTQMYSFSKFPKNTKINGVDCSGLSVDEAAMALKKEWDNQTFYIYKSKEVTKSVTEEENAIKTSNETLSDVIEENKLGSKNHGKVLDSFKVDFKYSIRSSLRELLRPSFINAIKRTLHLNTTDLAVKMNVVTTTTSDSFKKQFAKFSIFKEDGKTIKTKDAAIDFTSEDFKISKEVYGNDVDKDKVLETIYKNVSEGKFYLNYNEKEFSKSPKVLSTDETLVKEQSYLKSLSVPTITYKMPSKTVTLGKNQVVQMYGINADTVKEKMNEDTLTVDNKAVKSMVQKLANKYNTVGKTRKFKSTKRGVVKVSGGDYGYKINVSKEAKKLSQSLTAKKDVNRAPVYSRKGYKGAKDIGNSYVEVDIKNQRLWMYKNGKLVITFSVVTGSENAGHGTHSGVYYLKYKARHVTLKGSNGDGSDYASPVSYWMPFNGGEGIHDASWRSSFGGSIYLTSGSHGCVNCPSSKVGTVYNNISAGYPVVVFR